MPSDPGALAPFAELGQFEIHAPSVRLLGERFCRQNYVAVLGQVDVNASTPIEVAVLDPHDRNLLDDVTRVLRRPLSAVRLNAWEINRVLDVGFHHRPPPITARLPLYPVTDISHHPSRPPADTLNDIFGRAIGLGASDIHIETYEHDVDVRLRIDGILHQIPHPLALDTIATAISRLKILARLDITERRVAQDGRLQATYHDGGESRPVDFRLSIIPGPFGENAVLRVLDGRHTIIDLDELGMSQEVFTRMQSLVESPDGLILVNGPTGSGKTTTLYASLRHINTDANKVLTVENPIEYYFPKINQMQLTSSMGFADYARAFLRHDPEIMMIGEVRDEATASIAIRAAQTGHLVLSTLHANDAVSTVSRLRTLNVEPDLIADSLLASLSQRLVRKLCVHCVHAAEGDDADHRLMKLLQTRLAYQTGTGCAQCHHTGYAKRTGLYELFVVTSEISEMIARDTPAQTIRQHARNEGMQTLVDDGLRKVAAGVTDLAELRRVISYRLFSEHAS